MVHVVVSDEFFSFIRSFIRVKETLDALGSALDAFDGAIVIVSHNQRK
jgi:hypothetical protein